MTTNQKAVDAADVVTTTRIRLDALLEAEALLQKELPAARDAWHAATRKFKAATRPGKDIERKSEVAALRRRIAEAATVGEPNHVHVL